MKLNVDHELTNLLRQVPIKITRVVDLASAVLCDDAGAGTGAGVPGRQLALQVLRRQHTSLIGTLASRTRVVPVRAVHAETLELVHEIRRHDIAQAQI